MNKVGKLMLVLTSLAPIAGACAVNAFAGDKMEQGIWYASVGVLMVLVCSAMVWACKSQIAEEPLVTKKVKGADKEVLTFLVAYLLPLLTRDTFFAGNLLTPIYIVVVLVFCVYHSNAFTFNPLLAIAGFHFYEVENENGMNYLLLSRRTIHRNDDTLRVKQIGDYIYIEV